MTACLLFPSIFNPTTTKEFNASRLRAATFQLEVRRNFRNTCMNIQSLKSSRTLLNQLEIAASSLEQFQLRRQIISEWALGKKNTNWFWDKNPYNHLLTTTVRITVLQIKLSLIVFFIVKANLWLTTFSPSSLLFVCLFPLYQPCSTTGLKIHIQLYNFLFNIDKQTVFSMQTGFFFPPIALTETIIYKMCLAHWNGATVNKDYSLVIYFKPLQNH